MLYFVIGVVAFMAVYSWTAAEAERRGDTTAGRSAQGAVALGWIVLAVLGLLFLGRGC